MSRPSGVIAIAGAAALVAALAELPLLSQEAEPANGAPNPYWTVENHFKLPAGRTWGATSAVDMAPDGQSIWVADRCGEGGCVDRRTGQMSKVSPIMRFDLDGNLIATFGAGLLASPHGIHVDAQGNVWVTDNGDNAPAAPAPAAGDPAPVAAAPRPGAGATVGHQVLKFSPDGRLLMSLGRPGGALAPDHFFQPNDVITNQQGEIFVAEGHSSVPGAHARILKLAPDGTLIKVIGRRGTGPVEFDQPHGLAFDSRGRLYVADRSNNRIQILDQEGNFIAEWLQFSRPSGLWIDPNGMLYSADADSGASSNSHGAWKRGIRIGSVTDGKVIAFIPDPVEKATGSNAAEGVAVDREGNIYGAEVGPRAVKKYVRK